MGLSLWNGVLTLNIATEPTFSWAVPLWCKMANYQYFLLCEAAAHVMNDQSGFQCFKSFPLGLLMAGILQFYFFCGS